MAKHALLDPPRTTIPADSLAFAIGKPGDPNQIRGYWVRQDGTSHMELEDGHGGHLDLDLAQIPTLAAMLRGAPALEVKP